MTWEDNPYFKAQVEAVENAWPRVLDAIVRNDPDDAMEHVRGVVVATPTAFVLMSLRLAKGLADLMREIVEAETGLDTRARGFFGPDPSTYTREGERPSATALADRTVIALLNQEQESAIAIAVTLANEFEPERLTEYLCALVADLCATTHGEPEVVSGPFTLDGSEDGPQ